jgi:hypothetical protein
VVYREAYSLGQFVGIDLPLEDEALRLLKMSRVLPKMPDWRPPARTLPALANQTNEPSMGASALQLSVRIWQGYLLEWQSADDDGSSRR